MREVCCHLTDRPPITWSCDSMFHTWTGAVTKYVIAKLIIYIMLMVGRRCELGPWTDESFLVFAKLIENKHRAIGFIMTNS
jgi:hypothetical protein